MATAVYFEDFPVERISFHSPEVDSKKSQFVRMHLDGEALPQVQLNYDDTSDEFLVTPFGLSNPKDALESGASADANKKESSDSLRLNVDLQVMRSSTLKAFFDRLDAHVLAHAARNAAAWFPDKADMFKDETTEFVQKSVKMNFVRSVHVHKPKKPQVGWSEDRYEPVLRTKLSVFKPTPETRATAAAEGKAVREGATMQVDVLHASRKFATKGSVDQIARFTRLGRVIIEIGRIWFMSGTFGIQYNIRSALLDASGAQVVQPVARPGSTVVPCLDHAPEDSPAPPPKRARVANSLESPASPSPCSEPASTEADLE